MIYRTFGRTQLQMPVFSCGGMRYQHKWDDVPLSQVPTENQLNLENTITRAIQLGINHIETARGYGSSERQLGLILPKFPREKLIVQTKIGPEDNPDLFTNNFHESLQRLNLQYVDLLAIHGINDDQTLHQSIRKNGCLHAARKLQQQGLAKHIGFSTHGSTQTILQTIQHQDDGGFDYVNLHWYYILQINWPAIQLATQQNMGVFIISPSDKGGQLYQPPEKLSQLCQPLHPMVFNDLFCLSHPQVHTLSIGAAKPQDFDLHLQTLPFLQQGPTHIQQTLQPILEKLQQQYNNHIDEKIRRPWDMNLPSWENTPGHINIQIALWLRNLAVAYDMKGFGQMRYNLLGNGGHWFPGQTAEQIDQLNLQTIAKNAGLEHQLIPLLKEAHQMLVKQKITRLSQSD